MLKFVRPLNLLLTVFAYALGSSIAAYLHNAWRISSFTLGLLILTFAQIGMNLLAEVFRPPNEPLLAGETPKEKLALRNQLLYTALTFFAASVTCAYFLLLNYKPAPLAFYFIVSFIFSALLYALPPLRLVNRGFGELILAVQSAYLAPALGYWLQADEAHNLLTFIAAPLTLLALACFLALDFPSFANDEKYQRGTLLRLLTWERAIPLHHALLACAYGIFTLAPLFGFSLRLIWPVFLALPFAGFQIFQLHSISLGAKPNWRLLITTSYALFGLTVYLLLTSFWR